jgi:hypothetical protein
MPAGTRATARRGGRAARALRRIGDELRPLGAAGLALLVLAAVVARLGPGGNRTKLAAYVLLGSAFPLALLAGAVARRRAGRGGRVVAGAVTVALAGVALAGAGVFLVRYLDPVVLALGVGNAALLALVRAARRRTLTPAGAAVWELRPAWPSDAEWPGLLARSAVVVAAWAFAAKLVYWGSLEAFTAQSLYRPLVLFAAMVLVTLNLGRDPEPPAPAPGRRRRARTFDLGALALIVLASLRVDTLGAPSPVDIDGVGITRFMHWGVAVGPVELVRQGGWLLWDVPSTYGFLSTLAVAWVPVESPWQAYYIVHAALTALTTMLLYALLRSLRTGPTNPLFALVTTLTAAFFLPGIAFYITGPSVHPPMAAYRYAWCFALLGVLVWESRSTALGRDRWAIPLAGTVACVLGVLWSAESAVYSSATWLPAFAVMSWRRARAGGDGPVRLRALLTQLMLAPAALGLALAGITAWYLAALGHAPDWARALDFLRAFSVEGRIVEEETHRPDGPVWLLLALFAGASAIAAATLARRRASCATIAPAVGAWGMLWAVSGYYALRVHPLFLHCVSPVLWAGLALLYGLAGRDRRDRRPAALARVAAIPALTVLITLGFGNGARLPDWLHALRRGYVARVDRLLPAIEPDLARLLAAARVRPDDPIMYLGNIGGKREYGTLGAWSRPRPGRAPHARWHNRAWTPGLPFLLFGSLPPEVATIYTDRFAARAGLGGWLVESKVTPPDAGRASWFYRAIARTHVPTGTPVEDARWRLVRYEPRAVAASLDLDTDAPPRR